MKNWSTHYELQRSEDAYRRHGTDGKGRGQDIME